MSITQNGVTIDALEVLLALAAQDEFPVWDADGTGEPTKKITAQTLANAIKTLADLQGRLTFDTTPTSGSTNPVTSDGVASALDDKQDVLTFDATPTPGSTNPVTSGGVANAFLQNAPYAVTITTGQWSGSGSDRYITVNASNVTADSILIPQYDHDSDSLLNGPIWCVPANGSFTIHTTAIPSGSITVVVLFAGTMGEAQYQVLADVYSKSQTYSKTETDSAIAQSTASSYVAWTATGQTSGNIYLARSGKVRILSLEDVVIPSGATFSITAMPVGDRPAFLTVSSLYAGGTLCAAIWIYATGTFGTAGTSGHTINGQIVWIAA